jgi:hypothetical protein
VLGDDVTVGDEIYVNGGSVLPHKTIKANIEGKRHIVLPQKTFANILNQSLLLSCKRKISMDFSTSPLSSLIFILFTSLFRVVLGTICFAPPSATEIKKDYDKPEELSQLEE